MHNNTSLKHYILIFILLIGFISPFNLNTAAYALGDPPGTLDNSFDSDGLVTTPIGSSDDEARSVAIQPDGKIVVAGRFSNPAYDDFFVARYNDNGSLDTSFDIDGIVTTNFEGDDVARAMVIQDDGKIVVAGYTASLDSSSADFALARYNTDGSLDTSFDTDGKVITSLGSGYDYPSGVSIQPDGKIVVVGGKYSGINDYDIAVLRYNIDGSLDTNFDTDGIVITAIGSSRDNYGVSINIDNNNKIVVGGSHSNGSNADFLLLRYNPNGSLDTSFDIDGFVIQDFGIGFTFIDRGTHIAIQEDGKIVAAGHSNDGYFLVARYNENGSLDTSFDSDGLVNTLGGGVEDIRGIVLQENGKIIIAGYSSVDNDFTVLRYNTNGSLDSTFSSDGKVFTDFGSDQDDLGNALAIQVDGKIVVAGYTYIGGSNYDVAVARYWGDDPSQTYYVKWDASGLNDGTSWTNAYTDLQSAISIASSGDRIWVAAGTYKPTSSTDRTISFVLKNGIEIYGGFAGNETILSQRDVLANLTVLSGDLSNNDVGFTNNTENTYQIVVGSGTDASAVLDGFTISGGNSNQYPYQWGGGIYNNVGSPTLRNLIFNNNSASSRGGGMYNINSNSILSNVSFIGNTSYDGGGIYNINSNLEVNDSLFEDNTAENSGGAIYNESNSAIILTDTVFINNNGGTSGGAILNTGSSPTLENVLFENNFAAVGGAIHNGYDSNPNLVNAIFTENTASLIGGAIYNIESSPILTNVDISNNVATALFGGGMYSESNSNPTLTNVNISGNSAGSNGGGMYNHQQSQLTLTNVIFSGNHAIGDGGGIYNSSSTLTLTNSTLEQNTATDGAGIFNVISTANIVNSTFFNNQSSDEGGAIFNNGIVSINNGTFSGNSATTEGGGIFDVGSSLTLDNTIIANSLGGDCIFIGGSISGKNNLIEDIGFNACGLTNGVDGNIIGSDPNLGTLTGSPAYLPLILNSPAIDAGDNATCEATDQRGVARPFGSNCDIGAYEYSIANIDVTIGTNVMGNYELAPSESKRVNYAGVDSGPVVVEALDGSDIIAALRDAYFVNGQVESFVQLMGLPEESLSTTYYFPAYNNVTLDGQLRFGNVGDDPTTVTVTIAGVVRGTYPLNPGEAKRVNYVGLDSGPVVVQSSGEPIIAALRDAYFVDGKLESFAQLMGLPEENLSTTYYFPAYNNVTLDGQLRIGNVGDDPTTVTVTIAGVVRGAYPLNPSQAVRVNYPLDAGPVVVQSSGEPIIAALRDAYFVDGKLVSFVQLMGLPQQQLSTNYNFPAYNNVTLDGQLRFGNVGDDPTTVTVTIAGVVRGTYPLDPSQAKRVNYAGLDAGPVVISSSGGIPIIAALRDAYFVNGKIESFAQLMGLPQELLSSAYYFPAYNNVTLDGQLRFGVP